MVIGCLKLMQLAINRYIEKLIGIIFQENMLIKAIIYLLLIYNNFYG